MVLARKSEPGWEGGWEMVWRAKEPFCLDTNSEVRCTGSVGLRSKWRV